MKKVKIRVFGATGCHICKKQTDAFDESKISYVFIDALADDTQDFCDEHGVDELPHVQIVSLGGKDVFNKAGFVSVSEVKKFLQ